MSKQQQPTYYVNISLFDMVLEEEQAHIKTTDCEISISLGKKLLGKIPFSKKDAKSVKVPLSTQISQDKIVILTKTIGANAEVVGSVTIPQYIVLNGGLNTYNQWITLFEHQDDDEYDGQMGLNDDEEPRIHVRFEIAQEVLTTEKKKVTAQTTTTRGTRPTGTKAGGSPRVAAPAQPKTAATQPKFKQQQAAPAKAQNPRAAAKATPAQPEPQPELKPEPQPKTPVKQVAPVEVAPQKDVINIESEMAANPKKAHDPQWLKELLIQKIQDLGDNIADMQKHNFQIESDVLQRLQLLKSFNNELVQVNDGAKAQCDKLRVKLDERKKEHDEQLGQEDQVVDTLKDKLVGLEDRLLDLRYEADKVEIQANGVVARHVENLTVDVQRSGQVDKTALVKAQDSHRRKEFEKGEINEKIRDHVRDIQTQASYYNGKINEFEVLLLNVNRERATYSVEIQKLQAELTAETATASLGKLQTDQLNGNLEILKEEITGVEEQILSGKDQGEDLYSAMRDRISAQETQIFEVSGEVSSLTNGRLPNLNSEQRGFRSDMERLEELARKYNEIDRDLFKFTEEFEKASDARKQQRLNFGQIRDKLNSHLDENDQDQANAVNLEEVDALCEMIDQKDKVLLTDLMKLKDQINQKLADKEGFKANADQASSILINDILFGTANSLKTEKDDLNRHIIRDDLETKKLAKIIAKYQDLMEKKTKALEAQRDNLEILLDELKEQHTESSKLADELEAKRKEMMVENARHKQKLATLYNYDEKSADMTESIQSRKDKIEKLTKQIEDKEEAADELEKKITGVERMKKPTAPVYKAAKGDAVDEMLARYINQTNCKVPITRLQGGYYLFGTKKIYTTIVNGKLVVRVGGGYMMITEFIDTYAESELHKLEKMDPEEIARLHGNGHGIQESKAVPLTGRKGSPRNTMAVGSPRGSMGRKSSGSALKR